MAPKIYPDHAGRMPSDPRYGNPSEPAEEGARIAGAAKNLDDWAKKTGVRFSGGITMGVGGKLYEVPVGDTVIAQKVASRAIPPKPPVQALSEPADAAPEPPTLPVPTPQSWFVRLLNRIKGAFR